MAWWTLRARRRGNQSFRPPPVRCMRPAALHRLAILAKLADAAATFLECGCVLAVSGAPPAARVVLKRHFPRTRCLDDGVLCGAGERPRAKIRDDGVRGIVLCE